MTTPLSSLWTGFAASIPGSGHIRRGLPCQDASDTVLSPRPALIVCDGRGSALRSQDGAQGAITSFKSQVAVFEPMLESILDHDGDTTASWEMFSRILYRTLMQVKLDLAEKEKLPEKEFDFTVALAIVGRRKIGCFQVGDGATWVRPSVADLAPQGISVPRNQVYQEKSVRLILIYQEKSVRLIPIYQEKSVIFLFYPYEG
ncbi:MAG: protein phosphatase 2C domain-containing protein [Oligosphaeraceae bacterium]